MSDEYLHSQHRNVTDKAYSFLWAASASAIGFAMFQTADRSWHWSLFITFLAVLLWSFSFFASYKIAVNIRNLLSINIEITETPKESREELKREFENTIKKARFYEVCQVFSLLLGAVAYFAGHICKILYDVAPVKEAVKTALL